MLFILLGLFVAWIYCLFLLVRGIMKRSWRRIVFALIAAVAAYHLAEWVRISDKKFVDEQIRQGKGTLSDYE